MAQLVAGSTTHVPLFAIMLTGSQITGIRQVTGKLPAQSALPGIYVQQAQPSSPQVGDLWLW